MTDGRRPRRSSNYTRAWAVAALLAGGAFLTCKGDERPKLLDDQSQLPPTGGSSGSGGTGSTPEEPDASVDDAGFVGGTNCGDSTCRGAGRCVIEEGTPTCVCDEGYVLEEGACIVDEECIKIRALEGGCRQLVDQEPALALFFNVETCAGTTVSAERLGDITQAFEVLEDGEDLGEESFATVFDRDVESYVLIALDMSSSVANDASLLDNLIPAVKLLVDDLASTGGPVQVALTLFGRSIDPIMGFTADLSAIKDRLDYVRANSQTVVTDPSGTNLNGAVNESMDRLVGALAGRREETGGAVLTTGTLVTITDGKDTAGVELHTLVPWLNYVSIGVSDEIDDAELTRVGPQGSFLAPAPEDWVDAFSEVARRVSEYPSRSYLLAYCSPAVDGDHTVTARLATGETEATASCTFDASAFGVGEGVCTEPFLESYCASGEHGCASFLACGGCPGDAGVDDDVWISSN